MGKLAGWTTAAFLMHRVELKDAFSLNMLNLNPEFLMHRVELKGDLRG